MTPEVILLVAGVLFLAVATFGGGFTAKELSIPKVPTGGRMASGVIAVLFFVAAALLISSGQRLSDAFPIASQATENNAQGEERPAPPTHEASEPAERPAADSRPSPDEDPDPPVPTPLPTPTPDPPEPPSDQQRLLAFLPAELANYCILSDFGVSELGTRASLECKPPSGVSQVDYHWFATTARMDEVFSEDVEAASLAPTPACSPDTWSYVGTWSMSSEIAGTGQLLCFKKGDEARIVWTYDDLNIFAHAVRFDGNSRALHRWWRAVSVSASGL